MICEKCAKEFKPDSDVERLMAVGQIARLCARCAHQPKGPNPIAFPVLPVDESQLTLRRIEWLTKDDLSIRFMALPIRRERYPQANTLRRPRKTDQHVFVMSTGSGVPPTSPPVRINCNIDNFEEQHAKFRAAKTPAMWDPFTGVALIEVPFLEINEVEREPGKTRLLLKNGEYLLLLYS